VHKREHWELKYQTVIIEGSASHFLVAFLANIQSDATELYFHGRPLCIPVFCVLLRCLVVSQRSLHSCCFL